MEKCLKLNELIHKGVSSTQIEDEDQLFKNTTFTGDPSASLCSLNSTLINNACSSSSSSSSSSQLSVSKMEMNDEVNSNGPLYELSSLIAQLPIRRGLSKCYHGKSQSFRSLSGAKCIDDLAKKEITYNRRMKMCKSYAGGLGRPKNERSIFVPGPCRKVICKKPSRGAFGTSSMELQMNDKRPSFHLNLCNTNI